MEGAERVNVTVFNAVRNFPGRDSVLAILGCAEYTHNRAEGANENAVAPRPDDNCDTGDETARLNRFVVSS